MEEESKNGMMEVFMKDILGMIWQTEKEDSFTKMVITMQENG